MWKVRPFGQDVSGGQMTLEEERADRFMDSVLHLFAVGPTRFSEPLVKPRIEVVAETRSDRWAQYDCATRTITVFGDRPSRLERTMVHELVHAWVHQCEEAHVIGPLKYPHGPTFQDKLARVYHRLGWGVPTQQDRTCHDTPEDMSSGVPLIMDLWPTALRGSGPPEEA